MNAKTTVVLLLFLAGGAGGVYWAGYATGKSECLADVASQKEEQRLAREKAAQELVKNHDAQQERIQREAAKRIAALQSQDQESSGCADTPITLDLLELLR